MTKQITPSLCAKLASKVVCHLRNDKGSAATLFAIAAVPMLAAAGIAIDMNRVLDAKSAMQSMADRAALYGAARDGTQAQKKAAAELFAAGNEVEMAGLSYGVPTATVDNLSVRMNFTASIETTLYGAVDFSTNANDNSGSLTVPIHSRARYLTGSSNPYCIIALDPAAARSVHVQGTGDVTAPDCVVHADSNSLTALYGNGASTATASLFSTVGGSGWVGNNPFSSTPKTGQAVFGDPFAGNAALWATVNAGCSSSAGASAGTGSGSLASPTTLGATKYTSISVGSNRYGKLTQSIVYVFGNLDINGQLQTATTGTTIVLCGATATVSMRANGEMKVQAPTTGDTMGFAVIGDAAATGNNTLRGGPNTYFRGIWYTKSGTIDVGGNASFNVNSNYFPIIASRLKSFGTAAINVKMHYAAYSYDKPNELYKTSQIVWLADY